MKTTHTISQDSLPIIHVPNECTVNKPQSLFIKQLRRTVHSGSLSPYLFNSFLKY